MVRTLRIQRGWTVPEFAQRADISIKIAYEIEKDPNYNMKWMNMKKVGNAFGLPTSVIFFPEEELDKRALMAKIFHHCVETLRAMKALDEERFASTPLPPDRVRRSSSKDSSYIPKSHASAAVSPAPTV